jgi:replicative DNA helicase
MVSKFEQKIEQEDVVYVTDSLEELYEQTVHTPGLRWRLKALNDSLGSLRKGDFGFIFARPETGKTTFLASEVSYFAEQTTGPILWINNEEQGGKVKIRCFQASLGCSLTELYSDREKSYNRYMEKTHGNIKIYDSASINKRQVEKICKDMQPGLIIFDQIDKIKGFDADRNDLRLGSIYIWARELAKTYCPVIGVCQSDVSGEGKKWLTMDNVAESKTAKQAEADWILGIGKTHDNGMEYVRYLHIPKNKLSGDEDTVPELRHGKIEVKIRPEVARYEDFA